ncbi:hypothetical protein HDV64DRAFT_253818 [Trichoderma sp. TUCIM 5745]
MKFVLARILKNYRLRPAPGDNNLSDLETVKDQFTSNSGILKLQFEIRTSTS